MKSVRLGIVGSRRGSNFKSVCDATDGLEIHAVCDVNEKALANSKAALGATVAYLDYDDMLNDSGIDAVLISTPMHLHVTQSIRALERGVHVLCEVTAGVSVDECKELVQACKTSSAIYMLAENYNYTKSNQIIKALVDQGLFGTPYYAEGEYLHEIKDYALKTPWRRKWQLGIDGLTYCTHSLGPILQWMPNDRVARVCCEGAGVRHSDTTGEPYCQAASTMLCKTDHGGLIKVQVDLVSDRPHAGSNYRLQGTDGCYESSRGGPWDKDKIWLRQRNPDCCWTDLAQFADDPKLAEKYLPEAWRTVSDAAKRTGHGGGDYFVMLDFVRAVRGECPPPIGIHEAMDMTLPGLVSQRSIRENGAWCEVPDSREW